jgi:hypothetical protein
VFAADEPSPTVEGAQVDVQARVDDYLRCAVRDGGGYGDPVSMPSFDRLSRRETATFWSCSARSLDASCEAHLETLLGRLTFTGAPSPNC